MFFSVDLPMAVWRLLTNPVFLLGVGALTFEFYRFGFMTFLPKYMELYFGMTASAASMLTGRV